MSTSKSPGLASRFASGLSGMAQSASNLAALAEERVSVSKGYLGKVNLCFVVAIILSIFNLAVCSYLEAKRRSDKLDLPTSMKNFNFMMIGLNVVGIIFFCVLFAWILKNKILK
jgi:hypothetical protein